MDIIIWLLPILFIFHDFEEILLVEAWIYRNKDYLSNKFPKVSKRMLAHFENISTASFALGVLEEFIIISLITIASSYTKNYLLWIGAFIAFTLHLIIHCLQGLILRKYVPAIATSIICLPICLYIINYSIKLYPLNSIITFTIIAFAIMVLNLFLIHKVMDKFNKWLITYKNKS